MRIALGFAGIHLVFVAAGMALLYALGLVTRLRDVPLAIGLAYLAGLASVMSLLILLLVLGASVRLPALIAAAMAVAVVSLVARFVLRRRTRASSAEDVAATGSGGASWGARLGVAALAGYFTIGASAFAKLPVVGDDWAFWSYKAVALYQFGSKVDIPVLTGAYPGPAHLDYPMLQPLLESLFFRAMGGIRFQEWHLALWIVFAAFVWSAGYLLRRRGVATLALLPPLAVLGLSPIAAAWVSIGYGDVTVACFTAAGALCVGLWVGGADGRYAVLGGILLAGAANTKNEGLTAAVAVVIAAGVVAWRTRSGGWRPWLATGALAIGGALPWLLWRSSHHLKNDDVPGLGTSLDPSYLWHRLDRLSAANGKLLAQLAREDAWSFVPACFLVLAIFCLVKGIARREAGFYLTTTVLMFLSLAWAYWTGLLEVQYWLHFSADRVITATVFVCGLGLIHLLAKVLGPLRSGERAPAA